MLCRALRIGGASKIALKAASALWCDVWMENKPPKKSLFACEGSLNEGVGGLRRTSVQVPQHCRSRHEISTFAFQIHPKRPEDVLSVLEMVWINWTSPMNHLISDMGGELEGELGEFFEAHGTRQYCTASEAPWQNGLVERNGGIWKAAARMAIKDVGARSVVALRRLVSMVNWQRTPASTRLDTHQLNGP